VKLRLSLFEFFGETFAVFEFVEVGGDGVGRSFPYGLLEMLEEGLGRRSEGREGEREGEVPKAFISLQACSQALVSREEM
jgi:hypothetical protein